MNKTLPISNMTSKSPEEPNESSDEVKFVPTYPTSSNILSYAGVVNLSNKLSNTPTVSPSAHPTTPITSSIKHKLKHSLPMDSAGYTEFYVAVIGSVDAGKSSTVGVLATDVLDDGNGKARAGVFRHPHEQESGRTSDISYRYIRDEKNKRIVTFIDLAGHEQYLKTTINGLASCHPDVALVCISDKITRMTKEHIGLAISLDIPIIILFTKTDLIPAELTSELLTSVKKLLLGVRCKTYQIRNIADFSVIPGLDKLSSVTSVSVDLAIPDSSDFKIPNVLSNLPEVSRSMIPIILISNKTGVGIDLVRHAIGIYPKKRHTVSDSFSIEKIYNIQGWGTVVTGIVGKPIKKSDIMYIGPLRKGDFCEVRIKSIHNDFYFPVDALPAGVKGCICINITRANKQQLRRGLVLNHEKPKNVCRRFEASVKILHHHTTIKVGFQAYANCGMVREPVKLVSINGATDSILRSGSSALVELEFIANLNCIEPGQQIVFREGTTKGVGTITNIIS